MKNYVSFFKRDPKPIIDVACKVLKQVIIVGDIMVPVLKANIIDEVRFYSKDIAFIKNGSITHYKYREIKAEVAHSYDKKRDKTPSIKVRFIADDGKVFNLDLSRNKATMRTSSFASQYKDLLYQVALKLPRLRETKMKAKSYLIELCCAAMLMVIVLAG